MSYREREIRQNKRDIPTWLAFLMVNSVFFLAACEPVPTTSLHILNCDLPSQQTGEATIRVSAFIGGFILVDGMVIKITPEGSASIETNSEKNPTFLLAGKTTTISGENGTSYLINLEMEDEIFTLQVSAWCQDVG